MRSDAERITGLRVAHRFQQEVLSCLKLAFYDLENSEFNQKTWAEKAGVSEEYLSRLMTGRRKNISLRLIAELVTAIGYRPRLSLVAPAANTQTASWKLTAKPTNAAVSRASVSRSVDQAEVKIDADF
jgi:transcriptional regulator with XRE-family HTH domain